MIDGHVAENADSFEYLMVMPGVISALALGRLLGGASLPLVRSTVCAYRLTYVWAVILLVILIQYWHTSGLYAVGLDVDLLRYFPFLVLPGMVYLAAVVLFPKDELQLSYKMCVRYYDTSRVFFVICATGLLAEFVFALIRVWPCTLSTVHTDNTMRLVGAGLALVLSAWNKNERVHRIGTAIGLILLAMFMLLRARSHIYCH